MKRFLIMCLLLLTLFTGVLQTNNTNISYSLTQENSKEDSRDIPIIMYHSILKSKKGNYVVSPDMLKEDIKYLKNHGYQPIFIQDIINFCDGIDTLPKKPVVLSFDDGHYNNYYYAYPILIEEKFKANLNIIGCFCEFTTSSKDCDNPNYSYLTWEEIKTLHDYGIFEIGNHTYKMHSYKPRYGIKKMESETEEEYKTALEQDVIKLENKLMIDCGFRTNVFAYPFGAYDKTSENILKELGFKAFLTCNEGINKIKKNDNSSLSHLKRINRTGLLTTYQFFTKHKIY